MRKAINENPIVQIAIIVVLAAAVGLILFIQMGGGGGDGGSDSEPPPAEVGQTTPGGDTNGDGTTDPAPAPAPVEVASLEPGPGLPTNVAEAYEDGMTVMLAIANPDEMVDKELLSMARKVANEDKKVRLFAVDPEDVARYSRITLGVNVNRNPVLVVVTPLDVTGEGVVPTAWASYGYRNLDGVRQTVVDARFDGPRGELSPS